MVPREGHPVLNAAPGSATIRPWAPADRDAVADLVLTIQRDEFGLAITLEDQPDLRDVPGFFRAGGGDFWVAEAAGRVVGTIGALVFDENTVVVRKMFVHRDHRGSGGPAAALMDTLVGWSRRAGYRTLLLGTTSLMTAAHRFYGRHGFSEIPTESLPDEFPRMAVDTMFFRRELPGAVAIREPNPRQQVKRELAGRDWAVVQDYADAKSEVVRDILGRADPRSV